jgi:hypothetical protein
MNKASFIRNFPPTKRIPESLLKLFQYQELTKEEFSGSFYLDDTLWEAPFTDVLRPYFVLFGSDVSGSMYAFWLYSDFQLESAPVVYLEFEAVRNTVLANSLNQFLSLLSLGIAKLGYYIQDIDWKDHVISNTANLKFREWIKTEINVEFPLKPKEIINDAKKNHPDLNSWIEEKIGKLSR